MSSTKGGQRLTLTVAYTITAAWATSFIADMLMQTYEPPPTLTPLMLSVAGYCFAGGVLNRRREVNGGSGNGEHEHNAS